MCMSVYIYFYVRWVHRWLLVKATAVRFKEPGRKILQHHQLATYSSLYSWHYNLHQCFVICYITCIKLTFRNSETISSTLYPQYGNLSLAQFLEISGGSQAPPPKLSVVLHCEDLGLALYQAPFGPMFPCTHAVNNMCVNVCVDVYVYEYIYIYVCVHI